jgi:hypothetical protein
MRLPLLSAEAGGVPWSATTIRGLGKNEAYETRLDPRPADPRGAHLPRPEKV